jgi:hypothetical protein
LGKNCVLHNSKNWVAMAEMGQTRPFGDVGSMSGLPESGRVAGSGGQLKRAIAVIAAIRRTDFMEYPLLFPVTPALRRRT